jgi:hypothetical protein
MMNIYLSLLILHPATDEVKLKFNLSTDAGSNYNVTKTSTMFYAGHTEADATGFLVMITQLI